MEIKGEKIEREKFQLKDLRKKKKTSTTHRRGTSCEISQTYVCLNVCHSVAAMTECHWCFLPPLGERQGYALDKSAASGRANIYETNTHSHTRAIQNNWSTSAPNTRIWLWEEVPRENPIPTKGRTGKTGIPAEKSPWPPGESDVEPCDVATL